MTADEGPLLPRRRLGAELRRLRDGRTLDEVAEATMISTSKLSRLENGHGVPQPRDIRDLITYYGVDVATGNRLRKWTNAGRKQAWWKQYSDVVSETLNAYLDFEAGASTIRTYAATVVPGLLQTKHYSDQLLQSIAPTKTPEQISRLVEIRQRRQERLFDINCSTRLIAVLDEAVLHRRVGSEEETWLQLDRIRQLSEFKSVSIQVLPFEAGIHAGQMGTFTIFQFADDIDRDIVSIETHSGDRYLEEQLSMLEYLRTFDAVSNKAHDAVGSRDLLTKIMSNLTPPKGKR